DLGMGLARDLLQHLAQRSLVEPDGKRVVLVLDHTGGGGRGLCRADEVGGRQRGEQPQATGPDYCVGGRRHLGEVYERYAAAATGISRCVPCIATRLRALDGSLNSS